MDKVISLGVQISLGDKLTGPGARALTQIEKRTERMAANMTLATKRGAAEQLREFRKLGAARELIGARAEKTIQREIKQTELAYKRLKDSGVMSWREQSRAADAMKRKVADLRNEMGRLTAAQRAASIGTGLRNTAVGIGAAAMVVKPAFDRTMGHDLKLAHMSNTAFSDRDTLGRRAGMRELDSAITTAIRGGGGAREDAAEALNRMIASNMKVADAIGSLPSIMRTATGTGADALELSQIAIAGRKNFGFTTEQLPRILDMSVVGGQKGSFELRDMARHLPSQMALSQLSGLNGEKGFAKLIAANQASAITAGNADEAGINLSNLLAKLNSRDTQNDFKEQGINLSGRLMRDRAKGIDSIDSFVGVVDQVVRRDARWKQLEAKLAGATTDAEKQETYGSMQQILQGSVIGKVMQDRQALLALVGIMNSREYMAGVEKDILAGGGAVDRNFSLISDTPSFKTSQLGNEKLIAEQRAMGGFAGVIGDVSVKLTKYAQEYPGLTTALSGLTTAALAASAALLSVGALNMLSGKGGGGVKALAAGGAGWLARGAKFLGGRALGPIGGLLGGYEIGESAGKMENPGWLIRLLHAGADGAANLFSDKEVVQPTTPEQRLEGQIDVRVTDDRVIVTTKSNNKDIPLNVYSGETMNPAW